MENKCRNCKLYDLPAVIDKAGRVRSKWAARCLWTIPDIVWPESLTPYDRKLPKPSFMEPNSGTSCNAFISRNQEKMRDSISSIRDLPERVHGKIRDISINCSPTIATARVGPTVGRYAADLWRIEGNPLPWRVRAHGEGVVKRYKTEAEAVTKFLQYVEKIANGTE